MSPMQVHVLETPELGDRTYVVDDGTVSVVIDPQRDLDRLEPVLEHGPAYVLETHIHNDYVTGGFELARRTGAAYGVNASDDVEFDRLPLLGGQQLTAGDLEITVVATPGHTPTHLSYVVRDLAHPSAAPAVFSGGSLLYGTVGRTDLVDPTLTRALAAAQYRSARRLAELPADTSLYPTHGFGSFCAGGEASGAYASTIGEEQEKNAVLRAEGVDDFVSELVASFGAYPSYYPQMAPLNRRGPGVVRLDDPVCRADAEQLAALLARGAVVDLRSAAEFAADHLDGSVSVPLGTQFATYVGWVLRWGELLGLVAHDQGEIDQARRQLTRIGMDEVAAAWGSPEQISPGASRGSYRRVTFDELATEAEPQDVVVDVRRPDEYDADHVRGARHVPLHEVEHRHGQLPRGVRVWVYCAGGFRAGTATSLLHRAGVDVVHVDDAFTRAVELGLTVG
jgi:hydroxyacylglutathione hydrolase